MKNVSLFVTLIIFTLTLISPSYSISETLNPEGINPHAVNSKKKITEEQKKAAWEAKKKKESEKKNQSVKHNKSTEIR